MAERETLRRLPIGAGIGGVCLGAVGTLPTDYTFTGQRNEAGIGLMHYGARFYSPRLGRFISADTIVPSPLNPQDFNRYTYSRNNPLVYIDADGHFPVPVLIALAVAAAGIAFFRTPACAGEGCAPGTSSNSPEYQVRSYATAAETAVEIYFGAELLFGELLVESGLDQDRGLEEVEEVVEEAKEAVEQGAKEGGTPLDKGNIFHYDQLSGGTGTGGPSQLQERYPDTEFYFTPRGAPGADVEYRSGKHPSQYPNSSWPEGFDYGDFKPNTPSGARTFYDDLNSGKFPMDTVPLPYDPDTLTLRDEYFFEPK